MLVLLLSLTSRAREQDQFGEEWASLCAAQTAHAAELDTLRKANHQLSRQVRQLESSLAQINQEHCELVKQVVASRLEREELEDELVKCELTGISLISCHGLTGRRMPAQTNSPTPTCRTSPPLRRPRLHPSRLVVKAR